MQHIQRACKYVCSNICVGLTEGIYLDAELQLLSSQQTTQNRPQK